jgi:hypothetical protein
MVAEKVEKLYDGWKFPYMSSEKRCKSLATIAQMTWVRKRCGPGPRSFWAMTCWLGREIKSGCFNKE